MVPWMRACHDLGLGVSVTRHELFLLEMTSTLKSSSKRILLFCSKTNVEKIFHKVRVKALESRVTQWYIIDPDGPTKEVEGLLREGTQVMTLSRRDLPCSYDLFASRVNIDGVLR
ncbi:uncharacterized protein LOC143039192 [Oratosquilla oratoria]|uniref:uncharacterized protein LOC143039192 n=1 Tax=Oratosquilla oratoria TaxID=337810 RepID=UPI003F759650